MKWECLLSILPAPLQPTTAKTTEIKIRETVIVVTVTAKHIVWGDFRHRSPI